MTGAADGIGLAAARAFAAEGATVLAVDLPESALTSVLGRQAAIVPLEQNLVDADAIPNILETVRSELGGLDILLNNAGVCLLEPLASLPTSSWEHTFNVNVTTMFGLSQSLLPLLKRSGVGRIINTASLSAVVSNAGMGAYTASKHAVAGLTKTMAQEWGEFGITANYILPGAIVTGITRDLFASDPEFKAFWEKKSALGRLGQPEDVAKAMLFLASDDAAFISGHGLVVDGGALITA